LESKLFEAAKIPELNDNNIIVTSARQYGALVRAQENLSRVLEGMETDLSGDLIAEDLRLVLSDLAEITGDKGIIQSQEVLNNIFQHFCVGK
jgi:tRNA modification GTPase